MTLTISWQQCWQILETFGRHSLLTKILCGWRLCPTDILTEWTAAAWTDFYDSMRKSWKKSQNKNYTAYETCFNPFKCNTVLNQRNSWYVKYYVSARFLACFSLIFNWPKNTKSNILQHSAKTQPTEYFCCIYQCKTVNNRSMGGVYLSRTRFFFCKPPMVTPLERQPDRQTAGQKDIIVYSLDNLTYGHWRIQRLTTANPQSYSDLCHCLRSTWKHSDPFLRHRTHWPRVSQFERNGNGWQRMQDDMIAKNKTERTTVISLPWIDVLLKFGRK